VCEDHAVSSLDALLDVLDLEPAGERRFNARNFDTGRGGVVFGGQILAQTVVAGASADPSKVVQSVHTIFARGGDLARPLEIEVEPMHVGRALASATVTVRQGDRLCARSLVLLSAEEPDLIRHAAAPPPVGGPQDAVPSGGSERFWEIRVVGGVDIADPGAVGPPELCVWSRFPGAEVTGVLGQALLSYATDGFLIGTAMRPHEGVGQSMAHVSISTSVLSHTLSFHEPVDPGAWHLLAHERSYGRAGVFTEDGRLVASFAQDNMVRAFPEGQRPPAGGASKF
jgi:acyl-CoA thioesterase II